MPAVGLPISLQNDAGSGQDAPAEPTPEVWIDDSHVYSGFLDGPIIDTVDQYAFSAAAGERAMISISGAKICASIVDGNNHIPYAQGGACTLSAAESAEFTTTLPSTGTWFLRVSGVVAGPYGLSLSFDSDIDRSELDNAILPQDDAYSGRDAPDHRSAEIWVNPRVHYYGHTTGNALDGEDWYAFAGRAGDHVRGGARTIAGCFSLVSDGGEMLDGGCSPALHGPIAEVNATLPADGTYFLRYYSAQPESYEFNFTLDGPASLYIASTAPIPALARTLQNDAGSGGDAPDEPSTKIMVRPDTEYEGFVMGPGPDYEDWYAFEARGGDNVHLHFAGTSACANIVDASGEILDEGCTYGYVLLGHAGAEVPHDGVYFIRLYGFHPEDYRFTFAFNAEPGTITSNTNQAEYYADRSTPFAEQVAAGLIPQDDAGSGRDAPDHPSPEVVVDPGVVYDGQLLGHSIDSADFYAFHGQAGDHVEARAAGAVGCFNIAAGNGTLLAGNCLPAGLASHVVLQATLPSGGIYYFHHWSRQPDAYQFSFALNGEAPTPASTASQATQAVVVGADETAASARLLTANDAGSGQDAPNDLSDDIRLEPDVLYEGMLLGPADLSDWFAFEGLAGQDIQWRVRAPALAFVDIYAENGTRIAGRLDLASPASEISIDLTIPSDGTYYLEVSGLAPGPYRFTYSVNDAARETLPEYTAAVAPTPAARNDAGSGGDAPDWMSAKVRIDPDAVYFGVVEWPVVDHEDWYYFEGSAGDSFHALADGGLGCFALYAEDGVLMDRDCLFLGLLYASLEVVLPTDGVYYLQVESGPLPEKYRFTYSLSERAQLPLLWVDSNPEGD